jgi:hypothetical protein
LLLGLLLCQPKALGSTRRGWSRSSSIGSFTLAREAYEDVELEEEAPVEEDPQSPYPSLPLQGHQYNYLHLHQRPASSSAPSLPSISSAVPPASAAPTKVKLSLRDLVLRKKKQDEKIELSKVAQTKSPLLRRYRSQCHLAHLKRHSRQIHCTHHQRQHRLSYFNRHTNLRFARKGSSSPPDPSLFSSTSSTTHVLHHVQIDVVCVNIDSPGVHRINQ